MIYPAISEYIEAIHYAVENFAMLTRLRPLLDKDGNLTFQQELNHKEFDT